MSEYGGVSVCTRAHVCECVLSYCVIRVMNCASVPGILQKPALSCDAHLGSPLTGCGARVCFLLSLFLRHLIEVTWQKGCDQ